MAENPLKGRASVWPEDNEQPPQTVYFVPPKPKRKYRAKWLILWQDASEIGLSMGEQAERNVLTVTEYRVRDWLMAKIGIGNYASISQAEMCRKLHIDKANANRAVKRLVELGILIKGPKSGRSYTYMFSPVFCFSGGLCEGVKQRAACIETVKPRKGKGVKGTTS